MLGIIDRNLPNASYCYNFHANVVPLRIFSSVFISGRDYELWVVCHISSVINIFADSEKLQWEN